MMVELTKLTEYRIYICPSQSDNRCRICRVIIVTIISTIFSQLYASGLRILAAGTPLYALLKMLVNIPSNGAANLPTLWSNYFKTRGINHFYKHLLNY